MDRVNKGALMDEKTHLDSMGDFLVLRVGGVPSISHAPFVHAKLSNPLVPKRVDADIFDIPHHQVSNT